LGSGEEQALGQGIGVRVRESKGNRLGLTIPIPQGSLQPHKVIPIWHMYTH
jgi:hypothetical protein